MPVQRLRTGGYTYTLEPGIYGTHTADEFWFDRKTGFCEHIASSFVVLMRALGIPARVVTGYQGGTSMAWTATGPCAKAMPTPGPKSGCRPRLGAGRPHHRGGAWTHWRPAPGAAAQCRRAGAGHRQPPNQPGPARGLGRRQQPLEPWVLNYTQDRQLQLLQNLGSESPSWEDLGTVLLVLLIGASTVGAA